jgi:hypothetical protein
MDDVFGNDTFCNQNLTGIHYACFLLEKETYVYICFRQINVYMRVWFRKLAMGFRYV